MHLVLRGKLEFPTVANPRVWCVVTYPGLLLVATFDTEQEAEKKARALNGEVPRPAERRNRYGTYQPSGTAVWNGSPRPSSGR